MFTFYLRIVELGERSQDRARQKCQKRANHPLILLIREAGRRSRPTRRPVGQMEKGPQRGPFCPSGLEPRLRDLAAHSARGLPKTSRPLQIKGAGNAGRPMRPIAARSRTPLWRDGMARNIDPPCVFCKSEYFFKRGLTGDLPVGAKLNPSPLRETSEARS